MRVAYVLPTCLALAAFASAEEVASPEASSVPTVPFKPTGIKGAFVEQFVEDWKSRWIPSSAKKVVDGIEDEDLLAYRGKWEVEAPEVVAIEGDKGLTVKTAAAHHAISAKFDKPIDPTGKPLVVQYEVKTQNGLECGGAYLKLLTYDEKFNPEKFSDKTPYTIMFGPDRCASTNKVHFIFRHKNPKTGEFEEKHLKAPLEAVKDKKTNLYTLIITPDQKFEVRVNNQKGKKTGSLLEDFTPAVNPAKEIDDPEDKKPADWEDQPTIADPDATKPADWDENAPMTIPDEDAKKPADWLDNEPLNIPDSEAKKPDDWDDEEDGDWQAPLVPNPKCTKAAGCGPWTRPTKRNPNYKGVWTAPMITNPKYKGEWKPRKIANPNYFEDLTPANFNKIGAIGFELWTMQDSIQFDNIYIGSSIADAEKLAEETWAVKHKIETEIEEKDKPKPVTPPTQQTGIWAVLDNLKFQVIEFINRAREDPKGAVQDQPEVAAGLVGVLAVLLLPVLVLGSLGGGEGKKGVKKGKTSRVVESTPVVKEKVVVKDGKETEETEVVEEEVEEVVETEGVKRRNLKKVGDEDEE
ncbi:hypothetical protein HDV00_011570 [Rhizophlyctis rosea]|nr:hypothetical protein HDV00_011570 [Rhizophlyctis rosea]